MAFTESPNAATEAAEAASQEGQAPEAAPAEPAQPAADPNEPTLTFEGEDGQPVTVRQSEAREHFLRQADYTRKTQDLAQQRETLGEAEALRAALEADPAETVRVLQEAYNLTPQQAQQVADDAQHYVDPDEQRLQNIEGTLSQFEQQQLNAQVEYDLASIEQEVGGAIDRNALITHAIQTNTPNLRMAYRDMVWDQAVAQRDADRQAQDQQITAQKRADADVVHGGHSSAAGSVVPGGEGPPQTVRAAYRLAQQSHNQ